MYRVQGDTDSFGAEYEYFCQHCYEEYKKEISVSHMDGSCDYCKTVASLRPTRDPDEGTHGPVYWICAPCAIKQRDRLLEDK